MKNKSRTYLSITIFLCIVMIGAYATLHFFLNKKMRLASENESRILLLQAKDEDVSAQKKLIDETKEKIQVLNNYFIPEEGVVDFLETIESLDAVTGTDTEIATVNVKEATDGKGKTVLYVALETVGTFTQVFHLLSLVEDVPYEIDMQDVSLSRIAKAEEGPVPQWRMAMSFTIVSFIPTIAQ